MLFTRLSVLAAYLLTGSHLISAVHVHRTPAGGASMSVAAREATAFLGHTGMERRESGGDEIYAIQYCTDPHFTGQCAMPKVTLDACMTFDDERFKNSVTSFRSNDDCVWCELYKDTSCMLDLATIYAGSAGAVADGGVSSKGANFNDIVSSFRCSRARGRGEVAPNCPS